jgi:competence protein ComEC
VGASRREAVAGCVAPALAAGLALPALSEAGAPGLAAIGVAGAVAAIRLRLPGTVAVVGALLVLCLGAAASQSHLRALAADPLASQIGREVDGTAVVTGLVSQGQWDRRAIARFRGSDVLLRATSPFETGDVLTVHGHLRAPKGPAAGGFDERTWLARQGVHEVLRAGESTIVGRRGGAWGLIDRTRSSAREALRVDGGDGEAVADGVVLGGDDGLSDATRDAFRASGLGHLLAVSGQNVVLLIAAIVVVCGWIGIARAPALAVAIAATILYVLVVGPGASVVRAGITGVVVALAWLANRPVARWHVLAVAAAGCLWLDPWAVLEPGFQLSFAAVIAIFVAAPRVRAWLEGTSCPARLREPLAVSAACTLATAPIAWLQFGRVALVGSLPANVAALPAVPPLLWIGIVATLVHPLSPAAALPLALAASALGSYLVAVARLGAWLDASAAGPLLGLAAIPLAFAARRRRGSLAGALALLAIALGALGIEGLLGGPSAVRAPPTALRVTFLDVGQGNATLVEAPGFAALVDAGPPGAGVAGRLRALGIHRLDALVLSHPQADHVGGGEEVIDRITVARVLDPGLLTNEQPERAALAAARRRGVPIVVARRGLVLRAGTFSLRVLGPRHVVQGEDPNLAAIILVAAQGDCRILLPADAEAAVELPLDPPPVQVLEVAHHGSDDPSLPALLRTLRPRLAVISVGADNTYGHPAPSTLAALAAAGVPVRRTDRDGEIRVDCAAQGP